MPSVHKNANEADVVGSKPFPILAEELYFLAEQAREEWSCTAFPLIDATSLCNSLYWIFIIMLIH